MLCNHDLTGQDLPLGTLCLTYDDGPGPDTGVLGRYLFDEGIRGTFFVIGRLAAGAPEILQQLCDQGHIIANHTWSHPGLMTLIEAGGDPVEEVARADAVIRPFCTAPILFRPPYGSWRARSRPDGPEDAPSSAVAERLRASGRFTDYVGPVLWDINAEDWECWRWGVTVEECMRRQLADIERVGRGIILMHDGSEDDALRSRNQTASVTRHLIPELRARGYLFTALDAIPSIAAAVAETRATGTTASVETARRLSDESDSK